MPESKPRIDRPWLTRPLNPVLTSGRGGPGDDGAVVPHAAPGRPVSLTPQRPGAGVLTELIGQATPPAASGPGSDRKPRLSLLSSSEFDRTEYKLEWLIKGVLVRGQPCVFGGPRKSLKTNTLVDLALALGAPYDEDSVRRRRPELGPDSALYLSYFEIPRQCRVGLFSGESGGATVQETARRIARAKRVDLSQAAVSWGFTLPRFGVPEDIAELAALIRDGGLEVVILDPLYLSLLAGGSSGLDASNLFHVGPVLAEVASACLEAGATPILAHHARKNRPSDERWQPLELDDLAYAGIQEFARQWVLLSRREAYDPDSGVHRLWMSYGGSAGFSGLRAVDVDEGHLDEQFGGRTWGVRVLSPDQAREQARQAGTQRRENQALERHDRHRERILTFLRANPGGETCSAIAARIGANQSTVKRVLEMLVASGKVATTTIAKGRGQSYLAYRLRDAASTYGTSVENDFDTCDDTPTVRHDTPTVRHDTPTS
jgi:hypothetical protein